jgi:endonuclease YncB( thermonuclease family)
MKSQIFSEVKLLRHFLLVFLFVLFLTSLAYSGSPIRTVDGYVTKVVDGDTIHLNSGGTSLKVRLYGIDTPEIEIRNIRTGMVVKEGQPYGEEAMRALGGKVDGQNVRLNIMNVDRYNRIVAMVWRRNRNVNREMVAEGWAWAYRKYLDGPYASEFIQEEEEARRKRLGLWQQSNPLPPWEYRRVMRMR